MALPPRLSLPLRFADANPQKAPCFLPDLLADADHHGHHGHRDPECGWEHLCEPGGYCSLLSPRRGPCIPRALLPSEEPIKPPARVTRVLETLLWEIHSVPGSSQRG